MLFSSYARCWSESTKGGWPENALVFRNIRNYANSILANQHINKQRRQILFGCDLGHDMADAIYSENVIVCPIAERKRGSVGSLAGPVATAMNGVAVAWSG